MHRHQDTCFTWRKSLAAAKHGECQVHVNTTESGMQLCTRHKVSKTGFLRMRHPNKGLLCDRQFYQKLSSLSAVSWLQEIYIQAGGSHGYLRSRACAEHWACPRGDLCRPRRRCQTGWTGMSQCPLTWPGAAACDTTPVACHS